MRWKLITKEPNFQPATGIYSDWKELLSKEASHLCVYCSIHESSMGGIRNFHVEHYRPKSKFKNLINTFSNLFYACPICNVFKSNDWPHEPDGKNHLTVICYPDPSIINYADLFEVDFATGLINGTCTSANYIKNKLYLNRPQLIIDRKLLILNDRVSKIINEINAYIDVVSSKRDNPKAFDLLSDLLRWAIKIIEIQLALSVAIPYKTMDITKH